MKKHYKRLSRIIDDNVIRINQKSPTQNIQVKVSGIKISIEHQLINLTKRNNMQNVTKNQEKSKGLKTQMK